MKLLSNKYVFFVFLPLFSVKLFSQEMLIDLQENMQVKQAFKNRKTDRKKLSVTKNVLELPFIDDFSGTQVFPDNDLWLDDNIFINSTYPKNPLSIGIATFDAIDGSGKIYDNASFSAFEADALTSNPINLDFSPDSNIYISFIYQPKGIGNAPEPQDSFVLQFYAPGDTLWETVWRAEYYEDDSLVKETNFIDDEVTGWSPSGASPAELFKSVILPVKLSRFLKDEFQFRFKNYASLSAVNYLPSLKGNADHWHIDYIRLDKGRSATDTIINDLAFVQPIGSLLAHYEAIPWSHFNRKIENEELLPFTVIYRNNRNDEEAFIDRMFQIHDVYKGVSIFNYDAGTGLDIAPFETDTFTLPDYFSTYKFTSSTSVDSAKFLLKSFYHDEKNPVFSPYFVNDTVTYMQVFNNYYAYDDGTAEFGYGVYGEGTKYAQVACKFNNFNTSDTLRGVMMYFNCTLNDASKKYFYLAVWDNNDTVPGNMLYQQEGAIPEYNGINTYVTYIFDTPLVVPAVFYVGWTKTSEESLNIGFDKNRINNDKLFYNVSVGWQQSQIEGTIMVRPIFGKKIATGIKPFEESPLLKMYPNPVDNILFFENLPQNKHEIIIFDNAGRLIYRKVSPVEHIDMSDFNTGTYFIRITDYKNFLIHRKIVVIH